LKEIALNSTIPAVAVFFCNNRNTTTASSPVELKYPEKYGKKKHKINVKCQPLQTAIEAKHDLEGSVELSGSAGKTVRKSKPCLLLFDAMIMKDVKRSNTYHKTHPILSSSTVLWGRRACAV